MKRMRRKKLYHWFAGIVLFASVISLEGCGRGKHGASDALTVGLETPGDPEFFWYGVTSRTLRILRDGQTQLETAWSPGQSMPFDLKEGDELTFMGLDKDGRLLLSGTAQVGKEKKVSIPLRRIL